MPNCVKNVRNQRLNTGINCDNMPTIFDKNLIEYINCVKINFTLKVIPYLIATLYTTKNQIFNLLNNLFTHNPQPLLMSLIRKI